MKKTGKENGEENVKKEKRKVVNKNRKRKLGTKME